MEVYRDVYEAIDVRSTADYDDAIEHIRLVQTVPDGEDAYINAKVPKCAREQVRLLLFSSDDRRRIPGVEHHHAGRQGSGFNGDHPCTVLPR